MNKHLEAKMNELADAYANSLKPYLDIHLPTIDFKNGYQAGAAEVMKQSSKLVEALETEAEFLSLRGMLPLDKDHHILKALAEWKKVQGE